MSSAKLENTRTEDVSSTRGTRDQVGRQMAEWGRVVSIWKTSKGLVSSPYRVLAKQ